MLEQEEKARKESLDVVVTCLLFSFFSLATTMRDDRYNIFGHCEYSQVPSSTPNLLVHLGIEGSRNQVSSQSTNRKGDWKRRDSHHPAHDLPSVHQVSFHLRDRPCTVHPVHVVDLSRHPPFLPSF